MLFYTNISMGWLCESHEFSTKENNQGDKKFFCRNLWPISEQINLIVLSSGELSSQIQSIAIPWGAVRYITQDMLVLKGTQGRRRDPLHVSGGHTTPQTRICELTFTSRFTCKCFKMQFLFLRCVKCLHSLTFRSDSCTQIMNCKLTETESVHCFGGLRTWYNRTSAKKQYSATKFLAYLQRFWFWESIKLHSETFGLWPTEPISWDLV